MPKMKTNRSAAKRFRFTKTGKVKRQHAFANHILTKKSQKRKRNFRQGAILNETDMRAIRTLLPYGR